MRTGPRIMDLRGLRTTPCGGRRHLRRRYTVYVRAEQTGFGLSWIYFDYLQVQEHGPNAVPRPHAVVARSGLFDVSLQ